MDGNHHICTVVVGNVDLKVKNNERIAIDKKTVLEKKVWPLHHCNVVMMPYSPLLALVAPQFFMTSSGATNDITVMSHERHGVSEHQPLECLFNNLFGLTSEIHQKSALLTLCEGIHRSPVDSPHKGLSNAEGVYINLMTSSWRQSWHHDNRTRLLPPKGS